MSAIHNLRRNVLERTQRRDPSVSELARRVDLHRVSLSNIIHGKYECSLTTAEKIADALGVPLGELCADPVTIPPPKKSKRKLVEVA